MNLLSERLINDQMVLLLYFINIEKSLLNKALRLL